MWHVVAPSPRKKMEHNTNANNELAGTRCLIKAARSSGIACVLETATDSRLAAGIAPDLAARQREIGFQKA
jgi:hypothetical protein